MLTLVVIKLYHCIAFLAQLTYSVKYTGYGPLKGQHQLLSGHKPGSKLT